MRRFKGQLGMVTQRLKYRVLMENWRFTKVHRSGTMAIKNYSLLLTDPKKRGHTMSQEGHGEKSRAGQETERGRAFIVVSAERNGRGGVRRSRTG